MKKKLIIKFMFILICFTFTILLKGVEAVELIGITWGDSSLVSFDPYAGIITDGHEQLNMNEAFTGLAYDPNHNKLYALSQVENNLYIIDPVTLEIKHIGNLHIDKSTSWGEDANPLAYDPITDTLYTAVGRWNSDRTINWSELAKVNTENAELTIVGSVSGLVKALSFNNQDGQLYGLTIYGWGSWDSPYKSHVIRINPDNAETDVLFETPYHTMMGFAKKGNEDIYYSWINWTSHFYGETDIGNQTVTQLGNDQVGVISAMLYKDFYIEPKPMLPLEEIPIRFVFSGNVIEVYDPENILGGEIEIGDNFSGHFSYDLNAPYKSPDPNVEAPYGVSVTVNGLNINSEGFSVGIQNNFYDFYDYGNVSDSFYFYTDWYSDPAWIDFRLVDNTASALTNNNVLPNNFNLSSWDENIFTIRGCEIFFDSCFYIEGVVNQIISDTDGDGIPDDQDACPNSDLNETVIIDSWDTGVDNILLEDGCTIFDLISECVEGANNHGEFVSAVSHTTNTLKEERIISGKDKGKIQGGAANAAIP